LHSTEKIAEYLRKAEEADQQASEVKDPDKQDSWYQIAARYRELAMIVENTSRLLKIRRFIRAE
jgi:hypothetical protein